MVRGRKPKPTHLKVIEGNRGKRSLDKNEPTPAERYPEKPEFTTEAASECWDRLTEELRIMRVLHASDRDQLQLYCEAYGTWLRAQNAVASGVLVNRGSAEHPHFVTNPAWRVARDAGNLMRQIGEAFGLTPAARSRIELPEPNTDDLERILAGDF